MPSLSLILILVDIIIIAILAILVVGPYRSWYNFKKLFRPDRRLKSL